MKVSGFDSYDVSSSGQVVNTKTGRVLKPDITWDGYERVTLSHKGILRRFRVHRLVAELFIPNPMGHPMVNHIDGVKRNNDVTNLEWVDCKTNTIHAFNIGLRNSGEQHYEARLTNQTVEKVCELIEQGLPRGRILEKFPEITKTQFDDIRRRKSWKKVSSRFKW